MEKLDDCLVELSRNTKDALKELRYLVFDLRPEFLDQDDNNIRQIKGADSGFVTTLPGKDMGNIGNQLFLFILNILAGIIFLLACINVGTLFLARTNERMKDLSIRVALGAPRTRLLMQTMGESIVIALFGALLAVLLAGLGLEGLNLFLSTLLDEEGLQFWIDFKIDGSKASGTAVFIDSYTVLQGETPEAVEGTFEFSCDDDPYS